MKSALIWLVCLQLVYVPAYADSLTSGFSKAEDIVSGGKGNIFVSGDLPGSVLMKVNLWGAVQKSGIHYIPPKTDFITLLSYAGGPSANANLEDVYIKRRTKDSSEIIQVNIRDIISQKTQHNPVVEPNDVIVVPELEPTVSPNTVTTVGFVSTVLSIILASIVISREVAD